MTQELSAETLLGRVMGHDPQAREELFDYLAPRAWPMLRRMLSDRAPAAEVLRESFLRLGDEAQRLRQQGGSLAVWFVAVARGLALERLRRAAGPSASAGGAYLPAETLIWLPTPEEVLHLEERLGLLQKIVNQLPQSQRRALELAFFEGPSAEGIAPALGVPMARAMAELRAALSFLRHRLRAVLGRWTADI